MMGYNFGGMMGGGTWGLLGSVAWILVVTYLVLGILYFWKELQKK